LKWLTWSREELRKAPAKIDSFTVGKYFLNATRTLVKAQKLVESEEFSGMGALSDIKVQLTLQRTVRKSSRGANERQAIKEAVINDLHDHIYLKTPYSAGRTLVSTDVSQPLSPSVRSPGKFKKKTEITSTISGIDEDLEADPQVDSYRYMDILVESLHEMGSLAECVGIIRERLPVELYDLVERTIEDVEKRHPNINIPKTLSRPMDERSNFLLVIPDLLALDSQANEAEALRDLMTTLYERLEVVMQAHFSISNNIAYKVKSIHESYSIAEVWAAVQGEVKSMLFSYLANKDETDALQAVDQHSETDFNHIVKPPKPLFGSKFIDKAFAEFSAGYKKAPLPIAKDEPDHLESETAERTGHKLLISSDPRRVLTVYKPTQDFVERMERILAAEYVFDKVELTKAEAWNRLNLQTS
jgi:exocyst complex component 4